MNARIGLIGTGNMGGSIIQGLAGRKGLQVHGYDPDRQRMKMLKESFNLYPEPDVRSLTENCDYILLAVKPALLPQVVSEIAPSLSASKCLISVAAGVRIMDISYWSRSSCPVVRVMPNTPALVGRGVFALCLEHEMLTEEQAIFIRRLFESLGQVHVLPEKDFDAFTALIGSGPAYVCYFMESMVDAGVLMGLDRNMTTEMITELFAGTSQMVHEGGMPITGLKEMVSSPGGTTINGLQILDRRAVKAAIMEAVERAASRSKELGKEQL